MAKAKKAKKTSSSKPTNAKNELPDLVTVMMKVAERLEALEKKIELVVQQVSARPVSQPPQRQEPRHYSIAPQSTGRVFNDNEDQGPGHGHPNEHRGRPMYQAVCADCRQNCEVPFKPSGERPVYCKPCFAKRKSANSPKANNPQGQASNPPRQVKVTPNGAGKVTVSEIAPKGHGSHKVKGHKPGKKSKR